MRTLKLIAVFFAYTALIFACKKNPSEPSEPEPLLNRLDSVKYKYDTETQYSSGTRLTYNDDGQIKIILASLPTTYTYNPDKTIKSISASDYNSTGFTYYDYKINYENGLPVSGSIKTQLPSSKESNYYIDSIKYKTANGKVTEIRNFDKKAYLNSGGQLSWSRTDTNSVTRLTYLNDNLTKVEFTPREGAAVVSEYSYGNKNGISSANKMKFIITGNESPTLISKNELTLVKKTFFYGVPYIEQHAYTYEYNKAGFPKTSVKTTTRSEGTPIGPQTATYYYK